MVSSAMMAHSLTQPLQASNLTKDTAHVLNDIMRACAIINNTIYYTNATQLNHRYCIIYG